MTLEFKPTVKSINIVKEDLTKITLEVSNDSLMGKYDEIQKLSNKTVQIIMLPETYSYIQQFDRSTKKPVQEWIIHPDGTTELRKSEQTQLDVDDLGNIDIKEITKKVKKELIDEYIMKSTSIDFPGDINPRDVISRMNDGDDLGDIAESYEMSDAALLNEVEKARQYFAPFADAWDKVRDEVVFQEIAETNSGNDVDSESPESTTEEIKEKTDNQSSKGEDVSEEEIGLENEIAENEDSEDDPYK